MKKEPITPAKLKKIGKSLFGSRWKTDFSKELKVSYKTVQRWEKGETEISQEYADRIYLMQLNKLEKILTQEFQRLGFMKEGKNA